jgi:hypothetical protein
MTASSFNSSCSESAAGESAESFALCCVVFTNGLSDMLPLDAMSRILFRHST